MKGHADTYQFELDARDEDHRESMKNWKSKGTSKVSEDTYCVATRERQRMRELRTEKEIVGVWTESSDAEDFYQVIELSVVKAWVSG